MHTIVGICLTIGIVLTICSGGFFLFGEFRSLAKKAIVVGGVFFIIAIVLQIIEWLLTKQVSHVAHLAMLMPPADNNDLGTPIFMAIAVFSMFAVGIWMLRSTKDARPDQKTFLIIFGIVFIIVGVVTFLLAFPILGS